MESLNDVEIAPRRNRKLKANNDNFLSEYEMADDNLSVGPAAELGLDELTMIFSQNSYWISTDDLLKFRLVNKSWRDAATTTLLQRDACYVALVVGTESTQKFEANSGTRDQFCIRKHGDKVDTSNTLEQLTELMLNSTKFPASALYIHTSTSPSPTSRPINYADHPDLVLFFKLHGEKIKSFGPHGCVSQETLLDICFNYVPSMECLNLSWATVVSSKDEDKLDKDIETSSTMPLKLLPLKSLVFGTRNIDKDGDGAHSKFIRLLLASPSKLSQVEVTLSSICHALEEGKGDLIRSFKVFDHYTDDSAISLIRKYLELTTSPKLSKLYLSFSTFHPNNSTIASVFALIGSARKTLQDLTLDFTFSTGHQRLKLPPMKNLKTLTLICAPDFSAYLDYSNYLPPPDEPYHCETLKDGSSIYNNYFPSLIKVSLRSEGQPVREIMRSFLLDSPQNRFPSVDIVEWGTHEYWEPYEDEGDFKLRFKIVAKAFPNLRILKLECSDFQYLNQSLWKLNALEFISIYNISNGKARLVPFVDKFFTGFSLDMCKNLQTRKLPESMDTPDSLKFLRTKPSICKLKHLKEFKLEFSPDFSVQFASSVTGKYAFAKMLNTKFIISYDPDKINGSAAMEYKNPYDDKDKSDDDSDVSSDDDSCESLNLGGKNDSESEDAKDIKFRDKENNQKEYNNHYEKYEEFCFGSIREYACIVREKKMQKL